VSELKKLGQMAAEKLGMEAKAAPKKASVFDKAAELLSAPQKYASKKAAEMAGLSPAETSEENFVNLVDKGADALGIPQDSTVGNAGKALAVAAAEVFGDPLSVVPLGKVAKYANQGIKGLREMPLLGKIAETGSKLKKEASLAAVQANSKAKVLEAVANKVKEDTATKLMAAKKAQETAPTIDIRKPKPEGGTLDYKQLLQEFRQKNKGK